MTTGQEQGAAEMLEDVAASRRRTSTRRSRRCSELIEEFDQDDLVASVDQNTFPLGYEDPDNRPLRRTSQRPTRRRCSELIEPGNAGAVSAPVAAGRRRSSLIPEDPHETSYHPSKFLLYGPPKQRQHWGQKQILPRVNWGDLFFDLFYVAAAYNVRLFIVETFGQS